MTDIYENAFPAKASLDTAEKVRVVGSDNASYNATVATLAKAILENYTGTQFAGVNQSVKTVVELLNAQLNGLVAPAGLDAATQAVIDGTNTTQAFWAWYSVASLDEEATKYELLRRFFALIARAWATKTYTLRYYDEEVSGSSEMTPLDDLAGKTASPLCTDSDTDAYHWMDEDPMYWYIRAQALSLADGTMNVTYIEGEDGFDATGESAPVYVFKLAKWTRNWGDGAYNYQSWRTAQAAGFRPYAADVDPTGAKRAMTWLPAYGGGLNSAGKLTSGTGRKAYNRASAATGITAARSMSEYEGLWTDCDTELLLDDWRFRHFTLENSGYAEGCTSYNYQHTVAAAETGVRRVLLTAANAANMLVGSSVMVGTHTGDTNTDRATALNYDICDNAMILSKETVTVNGTEYIALNLDLDADITVPATAFVSTAPWHTGETDKLPGKKDGCTVSLTAGKTPLRVGGVEVLDGCYALGLDPLYNVTAGSESGKFNYAVHTCRDSVKQASSITSDYVDTGISYSNMPSSWQYVKAFVRNVLGIVFPKAIGGSSSTYLRSAFCGTSSAGVRSPWRFGDLNIGAIAGLACEFGYAAPSSAYWYGRPRLSGAGKKRGEWAA